MRKSFVVGLSVVLLSWLSALPASGSDYPNKLIRILVPNAPGGPSDATARAFAEEFTAQFKQPVVVENRSGGGGNIAGTLAARAAPDGYTLLFAGSSIAVNVSLYKNLTFNVLTDLTPISQVAYYMMVLVSHPSVPVNSFKELVAYARANPGKLDFASNGSGTATHLSGELLKQRAGIDMLHVPYKDVPNSTNDLLAGYVKLIFADPRSALPHIRSGKLRGLAVTGEARHPDLPDLPTVAEEGYPGFESGTWLGLLGPNGLPPEIVAKLNGAVQVAITNPKLQSTFAAQGTQLVGSTPQRFGEIIRSDSARWGEVIRTAGIKVD